MANASDKKKWDELHAKLAAASAAKRAYELELGAKYGYNFQPQWLTKGQKTKLEKLRAAKDKVGDKIYELVGRIGPRKWDRGVPSWWVRSELTWEDAIRPIDEPLSVVVPAAPGYQDGYVKETTMARTKTHEDVDYVVDAPDGNETVFKDFDHAAGFALGMAVARGKIDLDVLIHSEEGAEWYGGDDAVEQYNEDPEASVFERFEIRVNAVGRVS